MTELLTAAQMRAIEAAAIASGEVTGLELMERAGRGVVAAIFEEWPELAPSWGPAPKPPEYFLQNDEQGLHRAVVLCGPGNNGGDGFVVARLLREAGWHVEVFLYGDAEKLPPDARVNYERWGGMGEVYELCNDSPPEFAHRHLVVDALFGTGLTRPLGDLCFVLRDICDCVDAGGIQSLDDRLPYWPPVVAIDMPSGICADSGRVLADRDFTTNGGSRAACAAADLTVTFHAKKVGQMQSVGALWCGKIKLVDIGIRPPASRKITFAEKVKLTSGGGSAYRRQGHKYSHGHALILSGGIGQGGAARLAARGALRVGAGAVTLGCPPAALIENAAQLNAVMLCKIKSATALSVALEDPRINTLCLGPGMGVSDESRDFVEAGLKSGRTIVLDADALTLIGRDAPLFAMLHDRCVLTPHAGEFARLFPDIAEKLAAPAIKGPAYSKVDATRDAARRAGCVVLFKGPDTVIADPSGRCSINASVYERSAPWLATAGSGDVLAGFITGLLARGFDPMQAAESGAWLHTECALSFGPGLIAEDLPEELPKVFRALGL
ncbi:NAD(P)H-hydrate dehydratase [Yoonia sp. R78084]|uniref:NAD(P)H-hydrate dehydratase n=1 Tax=Yoonia sp. R78084 TaxID=3093869 RepID=UPI0037DDA6DF